ncbi:DUF4184 family protein [Brassicibacter mesophilus]|uniref:DUF4184 family protein n=1 Tax=Brassicibacter mesophilus TaxID=745119 RepID=UPI003D22249C
MPFTFSHPAMIIPIKEKWKRYSSLTGLALGSMSPDFEYFIRLAPIGRIGHEISSFLYFNLPISLLLAYIFHYIVKEQLILNAPKPISSRYYWMTTQDWKLTSLKEFSIFIYSIFIGMVSHIFWDSFTHKSGYFVNQISLLSRQIEIINHSVPIYKILQHGSTILGFAVIFIYLYSKRSRPEEIHPYHHFSKKLFYWFFILLMGVATALYRALFTLNKISINYIGIYIVSFLTGLFLGIVILSSIYQHADKRKWHRVYNMNKE